MISRLTSTESNVMQTEHRRSASTSSGISSLQSNDSKEYTRDVFNFDAEIFLDNKHYSDFTLHVGNDTIGVSSIVLAANSAYLKNKIENDNCRDLEVNNVEADFNQVWEMVKPLYNGKVTLRSDNLWAFVMFTTQFHIDWIFESCVSYFNENITSTLVFKMIELSLRPLNAVQPRYVALLGLCHKYLEDGHNMPDICSYVQENDLVVAFNKDMILFMAKVDSPSFVELVGLILAWLKLDEVNMEIVPELLEVFDFSELFKLNEELAEDFFTHVITGDYPVATRKRIMNLSLQSCKHIQRAHKGGALSRRRSKLKSSSKKEDGLCD